MLITSMVVSSLLAAAISYSAILKLTHRPSVVEDYRRAGVPERWLNGLAALLLTAAAGLVVGVWWPIAGIATAAGLIAYFAMATGFHVRAGDTKNAMTPVVLMSAVAALGLRLATAGSA
jgi:hypothetical protein